MSHHIQLNESLPALTFSSTAHEHDSFDNYAGKPLILYFYPKNNTPGCTLESKDFRDNYEAFQALNVEVLGVSRDTLKSHIKFREKHHFPFHLISDRDETLCSLFNVLKNKLLFGKTVFGVERSTFLIDPQQRLIHAWRKVSAKDHAASVLTFIQTDYKTQLK